ncbi:hypothetical protein, partial [Lysobacter sp. Root690]|uniref:hypothetical protein n=1 Tax=Lysobacter sp. Root690 TaxID=1736588 RepID=UPI001F416FDB
PVAHGVHPARRPSGVLLLTRVRGFAALGELRGFELKQKLRGLPVGAALAATANHARRRIFDENARIKRAHRERHPTNTNAGYAPAFAINY